VHRAASWRNVPVTSTLGPMNAALAFLQLWAWPVLALLVSVAYFRASEPSLGPWRRMLLSAHGASISVLHFGAFAIWSTGASHTRYGKPFAISLLVPIALIAYALVAFRGKRSVHWLQLLNLVALFWAAFIGGMAVTGDWL
jgi:hypothetical protein